MSNHERAADSAEQLAHDFPAVPLRITAVLYGHSTTHTSASEAARAARRSLIDAFAVA